MANLVTLEITFGTGVPVRDDAAELVWVADNGDETRYTEVARGATVTQETYPGHRWLLRGTASRTVLLEMQAQRAPALQRHAVPPPRALDQRGVTDPTDGGADTAMPSVPAGEAASVGAESNAVAGETRTESIAGAAAGGIDAPGEADEAGGAWVSTEVGETHRFERLAQRLNGEVVWVEKGEGGATIAQLVQLEAHVNTRWLWWASDIFQRLSGMDQGQEQIIFSAMSIAGAYQLDSIDVPWPDWLRRIAKRLGPQPGMMLILFFFAVGAAVAAVRPIRESSLLLYNTAARLDVRLTEERGFAREPSNRPGHVSPWRPVCNGRFEELPPDLRRLQARRGHHAFFVLGVVGALGSVVISELKGW